MQPVTGLLIVKNEAEFIERALNSLLWCDEIVVIDACSTDKTPELCKNPDKPWADKIRFISREWTGFSDQRNFAITQAKYDWVFFLDGDEACSSALSKKLQELLSTTRLEPAQYKIRRQEFFLRKPINHGIWNPSYHVRFFHKDGFHFHGEVHEGVRSAHDTYTIDEKIIHVQDLRIERFLGKLNHYTSIQARADYESGIRTNIFRIVLAFPAMFYKNYIYYGAYKDGHEGVVISVLEGISRTVRHLKIWQMDQLKKMTSREL